MYTQTLTERSMKRNWDKVEQLRLALEGAEAVVIGAGAGLSVSAGWTYTGERFRKYFGDFEEKYGFHDMYTGGFYPYETPERYWAYWSRYIWINRYEQPPRPVYEQLLGLVREKDYFILTTNVDHCFQKAGFDKERLFYTQGDYGLFQCSGPCCRETWDNREVIREMVEEQRDMKIPSELVPRCPRCGRPMTMNLRTDARFVEDVGWDRGAQRYEVFLNEHRWGKVLYWELGVGYNTPGIIKYPFWRRTAQNMEAAYACINRGQTAVPQELEGRAICIDGDIGDVLEELSGE